jgi:predicted tellurium resistance membrane protein TerC
MAKELWVMIAAVTIAVLVMLLAAGAISQFVDRHPTIKMLALAFLILIGVVLVADGVGQHIERGYIYFAMAFSTMVEVLNIRFRSKQRKHSA